MHAVTCIHTTKGCIGHDTLEVTASMAEVTAKEGKNSSQDEKEAKEEGRGYDKGIIGCRYTMQIWTCGAKKETMKEETRKGATV